MYRLFLVLIFAVSHAWADDFFSPPQLDPQPPPWIQDAENSQDQGNANSAPPNPSMPPPGFWGDDDDDDGGSSSGFSPSSSGGSSSSGNSKDSFKLVEPWNDVLGEDAQNQNCLGWGHPFLGVTMYQKQNSCEFILNQKLQEANQDIRSLEDHTRSLVLKEVIRGNINRADSKVFEQKYDLVMDILLEAKREGCRCLN
ncbi:MAG: hypothetical protein KDK51_05395 [Deltaproteobacteria bacterium]|nr:hypothetical protein [Deltaproteobacteria bacterium]